MPLNGYTFSVNVSGSQAVTPINNDLIFEETEDQDLLTYVRRCTTELVFKGTDYTYFYNNWEASGTCEALEFNINYGGSLFYTGILRMGTERTKWDIDNCTFRAILDPSGDFICLQDNWEDEINILTTTTKRTVQTFLGTLTEDTCGPVSGASPIQINGFFELNVSGCLTGPLSAWSLQRAYIEEITPGVQYNHYATFVSEQVTVNCSGGSPIEPPGDNWILITDNCPTDATYGRAPQMNYVGEQSGTTGKYWDNTYEVAGVNYELIDNGVLLNDTLTNKKPSCISSVVSDFFNLNPSGDAPSNAAYTEAAENLQDLVIFQKSDVKRPDDDFNAWNGEWTYKEMLESLKAQFNIEWRIASGILRIEHVSYFSPAQGLDLTSATYSARINKFNRYEYDGSQVPKRELFQFMETASQAFQGLPIKYSNCVSDGAEDTVIDFGEVNNDVAFIQANTDMVDDQGFVFVAAYENDTEYYFVSEASEIGGALLLNGHMSIPNLQDHYHKWDRPLITGNMNNVAETFNSAIKRKKQVELSIPMDPATFAAFDANQLVKSGLGWGEIDSLNYSARSCTLTLRLRHG